MDGTPGLMGVGIKIPFRRLFLLMSPKRSSYSCCLPHSHTILSLKSKIGLYTALLTIPPALAPSDAYETKQSWAGMRFFSLTSGLLLANSVLAPLGGEAPVQVSSHCLVCTLEPESSSSRGKTNINRRESPWHVFCSYYYCYTYCSMVSLSG